MSCRKGVSEQSNGPHQSHHRGRLLGRIAVASIRSVSQIPNIFASMRGICPFVVTEKNQDEGQSAGNCIKSAARVVLHVMSLPSAASQTLGGIT